MILERYMSVTRRSVLKAIAASLMVPCITLRPEIDRERLLAAFCDDLDYGGRYKMDRPFAVGSLTYATDARHMCRAEIASRCEQGERRLPPVDDAWAFHWKPVGEFIPFELPDIESGKLIIPTPQQPGWPPWGTCPLCDDRRVSFGEHYPPMDHDFASTPDYDVDDNTYRDPSCQLCRGLEYPGPSQLRVGNVLVSYSRLKPIAALPNVRIAMSAVDRCLLFQADGFEGVSMGHSR